RKLHPPETTQSAQPTAQSRYKGACGEGWRRWHRQAFGAKSCAGLTCPDRASRVVGDGDIPAPWKPGVDKNAADNCALKSYRMPTFYRMRSYLLMIGLS